MRLLAGILLLINLAHAGAQNALFIPDTLAGPNYALTMHTDSVQFLPGNFTHTYAFNSNKYLGPTLLLNKGSNVNITVNNQIGDTTTVHWHGLHVPSMWDGGPHTVILPNATWNPQFTVMDDAATYWYHPHMHMETAEQAIKGAAGLIIVRDNVEAALTLPRRYGIDDFPVIVQCQQFDSLNQQMPRGMEDSTLLVNGTINPYLDLPAQVVRLRLLNASGERAFNFGFTNNMPFKMIASDGGLLAAPFQTTRIALAPGERAEILLELTGLTGQSFYLMSYASEIPMGTQGGPTMPMPPWAPPMDSPLNGVDFNIMQINVGAATANPVTTVPAVLTTVTPYSETQANTHRTIRFTADSLMVMDGPFYFNDSTFNMMRIDYVIPLNSIEVWKLVNETMVAHPFHLHDMQFYVLDRNTLPPGTAESGRKDVILVPPGDSVRFITKFTDFADTMIPYMFHCHILMHEDDGMMGQFVVSPNAVGISPVSVSHNNELQLYPNPAAGLLHLVLPAVQKQSHIVVYNATGQQVYSATANATDFNMQTATWENGMYTIVVSDSNTIQHARFVIQH
jgi:bilirubin oxidase